MEEFYPSTVESLHSGHVPHITPACTWVLILDHKLSCGRFLNRAFVALELLLYNAPFTTEPLDNLNATANVELGSQHIIELIPNRPEELRVLYP